MQLDVNINFLFFLKNKKNCNIQPYQDFIKILNINDMKFKKDGEK